MLRSLLVWPIHFFCTIFFSMLTILVSLFDASGNKPHLVARMWGKVLVRATGTRVKVRGLENIAPRQSYILVSNHQSNFDIFACLGYLPIQFRWIAKAELFRIPLLGRAMARVGYISIERGSPKKAYRSMLKAAEKVKTGTSVMIFPEGTRSPDGKLQDFKKGLFLIALKSQAPILPITILGTGGILRKGDWRIHPGEITIIIDPAIPTAGIPPEKEEELSQQVRSVLLKNLIPAPPTEVF